MNDEQKNFPDAPASSLRGFLDHTTTEELAAWSEDELHAVFGHQWSAPLAVDLSGLDDVLADRVKTLATAQGLVLRSFRDLLCHAHPPLPLLKLTKEFAKRSLCSPFAAVPDDVARVLYFASIAAALGRCGHKITTLSRAEIVTGIRWCLSRDWIPEDAREVLAAGLEILEQEGTVTP